MSDYPLKRSRCLMAWTMCGLMVACQAQQSSAPRSSLDAALTRNTGALEARLNAALARQDYTSIAQQVSSGMANGDESTRERLLNWELHTELDGRTDSVFIMELYASSLYAQASHVGEPDRSQWLRNASTAYLRTIGTILTEAGQCKNPVQTDARLGLVSQTLAPLQRVLRTYPDAERKDVVRDALVLMQVSYPSRYPDVWLCDGAFSPYATWSSARPMAVKAFVKGLGYPDFPVFPIPKKPEIIPLFG